MDYVYVVYDCSDLIDIYRSQEDAEAHADVLRESAGYFSYQIAVVAVKLK